MNILEHQDVKDITKELGTENMELVKKVLDIVLFYRKRDLAVVHQQLGKLYEQSTKTEKEEELMHKMGLFIITVGNETEIMCQELQRNNKKV